MNLYGCEKRATLVLQNGVELEGKLIGYPGSSSGEIVFNTGMVGYPETFTDPSYKGQIQCITYPLVGNYGVPAKKSTVMDHSFESDKIHLNGIIISDYSIEYSHPTAIQSLSSWLYENRVPGLYDVDTRRLTKIIREEGAMLCKIKVEDNDVDFADPNSLNLVEMVSTKKAEVFGTGNKKVLVWDCGCKTNIIRHLVEREIQVIRVPWNANIDDYEFDAVLFSNGPGNPANYPEIIETVKKTFTLNKPVLGICLGHQIMALAAGAKSFKMQYGHRGQNQPVIDKRNNKCYITSQNHGYAIDLTTLNDDWQNWFENLNDQTNEGIRHKEKTIFSVQFHPEAAPGPVDTTFIFDDFIKLLGEK